MTGHPAGERVAAALRAVRAELATGLVDADLTGPEAGEPPSWRVDWQVTTTVHRHGGAQAVHLVRPAVPWAELLVELAVALQDDLVAARVADAVPPCPRHAHPLRPVVRGDEAWWACPADGPERPFRRP